MVSAVAWLSVLDNVPRRKSPDELSTSRTIDVTDLFWEPGLGGNAILGFGVSELTCLCRLVRLAVEGKVSIRLASGLGGAVYIALVCC